MAGGKRRNWWRGLGYGLAVVAGLIAVLWAVFATPDIPVAALRAKYANSASQFIELSPGTIIHVRDQGDKANYPVVLIHGSNASLHTWEPWVQRLVANDYRVITLDLPAHGLSGPTPEGLYTSAAYVGIVEKLVDRLGLKYFALGGNSMGGGVAWRYALKHPERLTALILVDASGQPQPKGSSPPLGFRLARVPIARDILATVTPRSLIEKSFKQSISNQAIATPAMIDRYWELLLYPGNRRATVQRFGQYQGDDGAAAQLKTLAVPTLIIWGREDKLIPVSVAAWFNSQIKDSRVTILDGIGHIPMEEAPDRSLAPVLPFLAANPPISIGGTHREQLPAGDAPVTQP
ncbi:alpha/beta fold hydrolase [Sandarakinorhabdus oryzae]|uniref:alpha/beta fold hydrolase n=1 Tax=Sandarakinorhabdus oryzae TaxID=2675220 RepID=UPI0012E2E18A|nr:alpha/beta hydrolase [Sandarakinorhabdus oryzae]